MNSEMTRAPELERTVESGSVAPRGKELGECTPTKESQGDKESSSSYVEVTHSPTSPGKRLVGDKGKQLCEEAATSSWKDP